MRLTRRSSANVDHPAAPCRRSAVPQLAQGLIIVLIILAIAPAVMAPPSPLPEFNSDLDAYSSWEPKEYHLAQAWAGLAAAPKTIVTPDIVAHSSLALREGPANGHAWLALAWGHALGGQETEADQALAMSWRTAPYLRNLARPRVFLALDRWPRLTNRQRVLLLEDVNLLRQTDAKAFLKLRADHPRLDTLWRLAHAQITARTRQTPDLPVHAR